MIRAIRYRLALRPTLNKDRYFSKLKKSDFNKSKKIMKHKLWCTTVVFPKG